MHEEECYPSVTGQTDRQTTTHTLIHTKGQWNSNFTPSACLWIMGENPHRHASSAQKPLLWGQYGNKCTTVPHANMCKCNYMYKIYEYCVIYCVREYEFGTQDNNSVVCGLVLMKFYQTVIEPGERNCLCVWMMSARLVCSHQNLWLLTFWGLEKVIALFKQAERMQK